MQWANSRIQNAKTTQPPPSLPVQYSRLVPPQLALLHFELSFTSSCNHSYIHPQPSMDTTPWGKRQLSLSSINIYSLSFHHLIFQHVRSQKSRLDRRTNCKVLPQLMPGWHSQFCLESCQLKGRYGYCFPNFQNGR